MSPLSLLRRLSPPLVSPGPPWPHLWAVLALAFVARAAVVFAGDFLLHPDELYQYLEPAHRMVFGPAIVFWEHFYGLRSPLIPLLVAGLLQGFDLLGLGSPRWYVDGVGLVLSAASLAVPLGLYLFVRRIAPEGVARIALLAGCFWYELIAFAHKPLPELFAAACLVWLLALHVRPGRHRPGALWAFAALAVLAGGLRLPYLPAVLLIVLVHLAVLPVWASRLRLTGLLAFFGLLLAAADGRYWGGGLLHSYQLHFAANRALGAEGWLPFAPPWQYLLWLWLASSGLALLALGAALADLRRTALPAALAVLLLVLHSVLAHKEYRFVFALLPLWLVLGALALARAPRGLRYALAGLFVFVSAAGLANLLPSQSEVYDTSTRPPDAPVRFLSGHDRLFDAYRWIARQPDLEGLWHLDRLYVGSPGYYWLHRSVPYYDAATGPANRLMDRELLTSRVSHILFSSTAVAAVEGFADVAHFGKYRVLRRLEPRPAAAWQSSVVYQVSPEDDRRVRSVWPGAPLPPLSSAGIRLIPLPGTAATAGAPAAASRGSRLPGSAASPP